MNRLSTRLLASHFAVAVVGGVVAYALARVLVPRFYDLRARAMAGRAGRGLRARAGVLDAVNVALLIGVAAGVVTALLAGIWSARRVMRSVDAVRSATRRLADGHYAERIPEPEEVELAALAGDVNALAEALADTERRRARLLGEVAHEMRTPLTVLDGYVEGLVDGVFRPDAETLERLGAELRRLGRLADDLSALSRAEERGFDLVVARVDLGDVVGAAAERLRPQFADAEVELDVEVPGLPVLGDADRLGQVVANVLGNALAATPAGRVVVRGARDRHEAVVTVADTGTGLAPGDAERIFERFYRAPGPRRSGSGIGLTIARGIVEAHGGSITAHSAGLGRGATVTIRVPLAS